MLVILSFWLGFLLFGLCRVKPGVSSVTSVFNGFEEFWYLA